MKVFNALVITVTLTMMLIPSANAGVINPNLIINGSFETPDVIPGKPGPIDGWAIYNSSTPGLGWTPYLEMEIQDHVIGIWEAYDGDQLAELDANSNGGMYQTVNTIPGQKYELSFAYSPRPGLVDTSSGIEVYFNNRYVETILSDGVGLTNTFWLPKYYTFIASGTFSTIKFIATGTSDGMGGLIDDVQFHAVPEPSTMLLLGSGLAGLVGYGRRRMNK